MPAPSRKQASGYRKHEILDAALGCFLQHGIEATTIEQIRLASGASLGSIYHHFGSKEAIALAVYAGAVQEYQAHVLNSMRAATSAQAGVQAMVAAHLEWTAANANLSLYLTRVEMADGSRPTVGRIAELLQTFFQAVYDWFQPFIAAGEIRRAAPALYVPLILGPTSSFARHWLAHRLTLDMNEVAETLAESAWNSLRIDAVHTDTLPDDTGIDPRPQGR
jgi:AcrR family transcriptional regulator